MFVSFFLKGLNFIEFREFMKLVFEFLGYCYYIDVDYI